MRTFRINQVFPCVTFFNEGRVVMGIAVLLLQLSVVFWPLAVQLGRRKYEQTGIDKLLTEFSEAHQSALDPYSRPVKKFRGAPELERAASF